MFRKQISKPFAVVGLVVALSLLLTAVASGAPAGGNSAAPQSQGAGPQSMEANTARVDAPETLVPAYSDTPPALSAGQLAAANAEDKRVQQAWSARTEANSVHPVAGPSGGETAGPEGISPNAANTFTIFRQTAMPTPPTGSSSVNEPSHATSGKDVFYTGNWYAAHSVDGGATFAYIDPYADFPTFCCDQDVVLDRGRNLMLWYRQGIYQAANGQNSFKLGASTDGGATFCTYTISPINVNGTWTNQWFDYPHLAVSNNYLYITTNMFSGAGSFLRMLVMKMPLNALSGCAGFSYNYWWTTLGWSWTPVQGATTTMYLGDTFSSAGTFRLYWQNESDSTLWFVDRAIPAWTFTNRNGSCPVPNGWNPCLRADQRITDGWVRQPVGAGGTGAGVIGFFWNVKQGGGFAYPYVNAATFAENTKAYLGRPYIWNGSHAWHYAAVSPDDRGDLGIAVNYLGGGYYPYFCLGIDDDYNGMPPGWEVTCPVSSNSWYLNRMGDYNRVRVYRPLGTFWTASGYNGTAAVLGGSPVTFKPKYIVFGRGRETNAWLRWFNK